MAKAYERGFSVGIAFGFLIQVAVDLTRPLGWWALAIALPLMIGSVWAVKRLAPK